LSAEQKGALMDLIPGIMWWSYHRTYWDNFAGSAEPYIRRVGEIGREFGFDPMGIELSTVQLAQRDQAYVVGMKSLLDENHLVPVVQMAGLQGLQVHADQEFAEASLERMKGELQIASWLGAETATFSSAMHGRVSREGQIRIWADLAARLADAALEFGLQICQENYNAFTADEIERALKLADRANLGTLNDIGNFVITGDHPVKATVQLRPWTMFVHVKDYRYEDGIWRSVVLGEGILDIPRVLRALRDNPGPTPLVLGMETDLDSGDEDAAMVASAAYLKQVLDAL
jgi:sugar phosphate isomerase/epimerase